MPRTSKRTPLTGNYVAEVYVAEMTRPDLTPEQEAKLSRLSEDEILLLRQELADTEGSERYFYAWDDLVKALSVPLAEASILLRIPQHNMLKLIRRSWIRAFKHRNRWRIWLYHIRKE